MLQAVKTRHIVKDSNAGIKNCVQTFSPYNLRSAAEAAKKSQIKISPMLSEIESKAESPSEKRVQSPIKSDIISKQAIHVSILHIII